jgi:fido (protein-threonine AMPylation protein)
MATQDQKLDSSLARLQGLSQGGRVVFAAKEMGRVHRDRLIAAGHLQRIIGGWLLRTQPERDAEDGSAWWAAYWTFCAAYCEARFGADWHLTAEQSLLLHVEDTVVPAELVVCAPRGQNNDLELLFGTSLYDLREATRPAPDDLVTRNGLRLYTLDAALVKVPEGFYSAHPLEAQLALRAVPDASGLLRRLLRTGQPIVGGRLAGAFRHIGRIDLTEEILATLRSAGHAPVERNPFTAPRLPIAARRGAASIVARLAGLYSLGRASLADRLPVSPGRITDPNRYLQSLPSRHTEDAFHGLWLDGALVTRDALVQAAEGTVTVAQLAANRDAAGLTALGDWQAFQGVVRSMGAIFGGAPVVDVLREAHREWYREWLRPSVTGRLRSVGALAGYRDAAVYLPSSRFVPPDAPAMRVAMPALFDLLESESDPLVRAVMAHWLFSYLRPYREGNGRMAHFLMNALLAAGGWQWRTIEGTEQARYADALDQAHRSYDLGPLAALIVQGLEPADAADARAALSDTADAMAPPQAHAAPEPDAGPALAAEPVAAASGVPPATDTPVAAAPADATVHPPEPTEPPPAPATDAVVASAEEASGSADASPVPPTAAPAKPARTKSGKPRKAYAPQPTQMGLFGE